MCGSGAMALPPFAHRRCADCTRDSIEDIISRNRSPLHSHFFCLCAMQSHYLPSQQASRLLARKTVSYLPILENGFEPELSPPRFKTVYNCTDTYLHYSYSRVLKLKRSMQMKARTRMHAKDERLLVSMGESIGSTLGAIAGRAHAVQKALSGRRGSRTVKRGARKLVKKSKSAGSKGCW